MKENSKNRGNRNNWLVVALSDNPRGMFRLCSTETTHEWWMSDAAVGCVVDDVEGMFMNDAKITS